MVAILSNPVAQEKSTERVDLRVPPTWLKRVEDAADRKGLKVAAYIRMVTTERMDQDNVPKPDPPKPKK